MTMGQCAQVMWIWWKRRDWTRVKDSLDESDLRVKFFVNQHLSTDDVFKVEFNTSYPSFPDFSKMWCGRQIEMPSARYEPKFSVILWRYEKWHIVDVQHRRSSYRSLSKYWTEFLAEQRNDQMLRDAVIRSYTISKCTNFTDIQTNNAKYNLVVRALRRRCSLMINGPP